MSEATALMTFAEKSVEDIPRTIDQRGGRRYRLVVLVGESRERFFMLQANGSRRPSSEMLLMEVSWEVCNQVGGIYTVLRTKSYAITERLGSNYVLVGPYRKDKANVEFEVAPAPDYVRAALSDELDDGTVRWGKWLIPGEPYALLVEVDCTPAELENEKRRLWNEYRISTLRPDPMVDDAIAFGMSATAAISRIVETTNRNIIVHCHEWLAGLVATGVRELQNERVKSIFTTHATLIGRYEAGNNPTFYRNLSAINADERAEHYGITARHQIEKAAAQYSDLFSTVSDITANESELFLQRRPEMILPNGLNAHRFTALHEFQNLHVKFKNQIHDFVRGHFFPSYNFDLDKTLYLFTSGRYEYRNKGMDIFIESLGLLRDRLKRLPDPPTVVVFIITKAESTNIKSDVLRGQLMFHDLRVVVDEVNAGLRERLLEALVQRRLPTHDDMLSPESVTRLKRTVHAFSRTGNPPVSTHDLVSETNDPVLNKLREMSFQNAKDDPIKFVFHGDFLSANSPLLGLDYDQFVRGCHMGVFPSYYEPWGYTPLECIALGIPTVTTDLSGFGTFVQRTIPLAWEQGIMVMNRTTRDDHEAVGDLATHLFRFTQMSRRERIDLRNRAERLTETFDWTQLSKLYFQAYEMVESSDFPQQTPLRSAGKPA